MKGLHLVLLSVHIWLTSTCAATSYFPVFRMTMDLSIDAADGAARHRNLLPDALPRISDALQWPADGPRLLMSLK